MEKRLSISDIVVENRHRKSFGDLQGLAHSIKTVGLLQAIGVTKEGNKLLFGERRLRATKLNGETEIDCRILDIKDILQAEHAENEYRTSLTLTEKHALAEELNRQNKGKKRGGGRPPKKTHAKDYRELSEKRETSDRIAVKSGFANHQEMRKVETVIKQGVPELIEKLDKGKVSVNTAFNISKKLKEEQKKIIELSNSDEDGDIKPGTCKPEKPIANLANVWYDAMADFNSLLMGVKEEYEDATKMLGSVKWSISSSSEKTRAIEMTRDVQELLTVLVGQMDKYRKKERI